MTKTAQSPTLFVTNIPAGLPTAALEALFEHDAGYDGIRTVRHMVFIDFHDIKSATRSMQLHNNSKFQGYAVKQGIMIDYDKDPRGKRNKAFTASRDKGAYKRGLDHEVDPSRQISRMAAELLPGVDGDFDPPATDATLALIEQLKKKHKSDQGVEVPLSAASHQLKGSARANPFAAAAPAETAIALPPPKDDEARSNLPVVVVKKKKKKKKKEEDEGRKGGEGGGSDKGGDVGDADGDDAGEAEGAKNGPGGAGSGGLASLIGAYGSDSDET